MVPVLVSGMIEGIALMPVPADFWYVPALAKEPAVPPRFAQITSAWTSHTPVAVFTTLAPSPMLMFPAVHTSAAL